MSSNLPENIEKLLKESQNGSDRVEQFRSYVKLLDRAYKAADKLGSELKKQERNYDKMKTDHAFFGRHRMKVDVLIKAMRDTYVNSTKALRTLEELAEHYDAQYVFEVCHLGSYRLGAVQGWSFLNVRSASRLEADANFENAVLPAIAKVLPDHRDYLRLRAAGIEDQLQAELDKLNEMRRALSEVQSGIPKWTEEMTALAVAMKQPEIARLNAQEQAVHERLVTPGSVPLANSA